MIQKMLAWFVPSFLRKIDRYLMLNYPRFWAAKFHYFIFYGLFANLFASLFILLIPLRFNQLRDLNSGIMTISLVIEIAVFMLWLNVQSWFSIEKEYGNTNDAIGWVETLLSAICVLLIFLPAISMLVTAVYKTANALERQGQSVCEGPIFLEFYSEDSLNELSTYYHYDMDNFKKALNLAKDATMAKQVRVIGIESAVFRPEATVSLFQPGDQIVLYTDQILEIEDGDATARIIKTNSVEEDKKREIIINHAGNIFVKHLNDIVKFFSGDKITISDSDDSFSLYFNVLSGEISVRRFYLSKIANNEAILIKEGGNIKVEMGERTIQTPNTVWTYYNEDSRPYETCLGVRTFASSINTYFETDTFEFSGFLLTNILLIIVGVFFALILKYSNWMIIFYSFLYLSAWYILALIINNLLPIFENVFPINTEWDIYTQGVNFLGTSIVFMTTMIGFVLFAFIQSIRMIRTKTYKPFPFINFASLPTALGYLIFILSYRIASDQYLVLTGRKGDVIYFDEYAQLYQMKIIIPSLAIFFLCYLLLAPLFKRALVYLMSLPRE